METTIEKPKAAKPSFTIDRRVSLTLASDGKPRTVKADAGGNPPDRFQLLEVGMWRTPWHGDIMIMPDDLQEYVDNYKSGLSVSGNGTLKLPINYGHDQSDKAAGWFVPEVDGTVLWATQVDWTPAAKQALIDGEWKCISAEFCPAGRGGWIDPLDEDHCVDNVLEGAALTNIPLYANLEPIMASAGAGEGKPQVFVFADKVTNVNKSKETPMALDIDQLRVKAAADLTDEEKTFVEAHAADLSADERTRLGIKASTEEPENKNDKKDEPQVNASITQDDTQILASIKSGDMKLVKASTLEQLENSSNEYREDKARTIVKGHIAAGRLVADQEDKWTDRLLKASAEDRKSLEEDLAAMPVNPVMAAAIGTAAAAGDATDAIAEMQNKAKEVMADHNKNAKEGDPRMTFAQAQDKVMAENSELKQRVEAQRTSRKG